MTIVRAARLRGFADLVRSLGGNPDKIVRRAKLPIAALDSDELLIDLEASAIAMEIAAAELACPDFGLRLSEFHGLEGLGPLAIAIRNSGTMGEAFDCARRYLALHNQGSTLALDADPYGSQGVLGLRHVWRLEGTAYPQALDNAILNVHKIVLLLAGGPYGLRSLELSYRPTASVERVSEAFGGVRVHVQQPASMLRLPPGLFDREIAGSDAALLEMALFYLSKQPTPGGLAHTAQARAVVDALLGTGRLSVVAVAAATDTPLRTLQRRLREEGTSLAAIVDDARRLRATRLLADPGLSLAEVGAMVDFADQATLSRAARRWWGMTPTLKRRELTAVPA